MEVLSRYSNPPLASKRLVSVHAAALASGPSTRGAARPPKRRLRRLTAAEETELIAGYQATHVPVKELWPSGSRSGARLSTPSCGGMGVATHRLGLSTSDVVSAVRLYRDGWSLAKLGEKFGVDGMTVRRFTCSLS